MRIPLFVLLALGLSILFSDTHQVVAEESSATESSEKDIAKPGWYLGRRIARTMSFHGADWLIRNSREREEEPQKLIDALKLKPGQQVCDFGCGNGFYAIRIAPSLGVQGKVYAVDIQQEMLDLLEQRCKARGVNNVLPVLATEEDSGLPSDQLDWLLMVDVYHELSDPGKVLGEIRKSLNPRGRIALVEYREEDLTVPIKPLHKMSQSQAMKELTANGFKLVGQFDGLPWQHVFFFARDDSPRPSVQLRAWKASEIESEGPQDAIGGAADGKKQSDSGRSR